MKGHFLGQTCDVPQNAFQKINRYFEIHINHHLFHSLRGSNARHILQILQENYDNWNED